MEYNLRNFPKVELHRHLEGSLRFSTVVDLARTAKLDLPFNNFKKLHDGFIVHDQMTDLKSVLDKFFATQSLFTSEEVFERMTFEACEDAFNEGVVLLELRYSPSFSQMNHKNMTFEKIHRGILKGVEHAQKSFPMAVGLIGTLGRIMTVAEASKSCDFIIENKNTFVAMDLADSEEGFDCKPFSPLFEKAKKAGLKITVHGGEVPNGAYAVKDAIDYLYADRIGHGVQIYKHPDLIEYVKAKNVTLELCPMSNFITNAVPQKKDHPFRKLFEAGVKTTINSDDPGIFGTSLLDDYELLRSLHKFTREEFKRCNQMAYEACFIPTKENFRSQFWK